MEEQELAQGGHETQVGTSVTAVSRVQGHAAGPPSAPAPLTELSLQLQLQGGRVVGGSFARQHSPLCSP